MGAHGGLHLLDVVLDRRYTKRTLVSLASRWICLGLRLGAHLKHRSHTPKSSLCNGSLTGRTNFLVWVGSWCRRADYFRLSHKEVVKVGKRRWVGALPTPASSSSWTLIRPSESLARGNVTASSCISHKWLSVP
jgi:hypothetical protein